jgi:putative ABC transport system substrate-binding protein
LQVFPNPRQFNSISWQLYDILVKQLELARELVPKLKDIGLLVDQNDEPDVVEYANKEFRSLARDVGVNVQTLSIRSVKELRAALRTLDKEPPQALIVLDSPIMTQYRRVIMEKVAHRLPVLGQQRHFAKAERS